MGPLKACYARKSYLYITILKQGNLKGKKCPQFQHLKTMKTKSRKTFLSLKEWECLADGCSRPQVNRKFVK